MGMRGAILLGDPTSSGGRIISASGFMVVDGKPLACVGDKATCHLEGHGGTVTIVEGSSSDIMVGRMIAYDGCALSCGCRAMATTTRYMLEPNRGGTGSTGPSNIVAVSQSLPDASSDLVFDEQIQLIDKSSGQPLSDVEYKIIADSGQTFTGKTGSDGKTMRIRTDGIDQLRVFLVE